MHARGIQEPESKRRYKLAAAAGVIVLDLMLVVSLASEAAVRLSAQPASSADG